MSEYVDILSQQIEEGRKQSRPSTAHDQSSPNSKVVQKKTLIPLKEGEETPIIVESSQSSQEEDKTDKTVKTVNIETSTPTYTDAAQSTEPDLPPPGAGGALWGPPSEEDIRKDLEAIQEMRKREGPSLFDQIMAPPPKPMPSEPTLSTYYDRLMRFGN